VDDNGERYQRPPTLADLEAITHAVATVNARLLIVDVLMAYLPTKVDSHRDQAVRTVLARLAALGERTGRTVLLLRHLNKTAGGSAVYRGGGSIGIIGAAHAGYVVAPDPDDDTQRVLACTKNNLAPEPPSLAYRLESAPDSHVARVHWCGETRHHATELLTTTTTDEATERDDAAAFIDQYLIDSGGTAPAREIQRECDKGGLSKSTLHRAAARLGVHKHKDGMKGPWWWTHPEAAKTPEGSAEGSEDPGSQNPKPSAPSRSLRPITDQPTGADNTPCDRCGSMPTKVDSAGRRYCRTCAPHLWSDAA
jgi:hypothetical protein